MEVKLKVSRDNALPLYYQLSNDLVEKIKSGDFPPNSMLPPEIELAQTYKISRNTVRHALSLLVQNGYLERIPGKGTFFLDRRGNLMRDQWVISSIEDMLELTKQSRVDYTSMMVLDHPPAFVMKDLELKKWNKVCYFEGVKYRDKDAVSYLRVYLPYEIGIQVRDKDRGQKTIFLYMEEKLGIEITRVDEYMSVDVWTSEDYRKLKSKVGDPKVIIKRIYFSEDRPIEVSVNHYRSDNFSLFYSVSKKY